MISLRDPHVVDKVAQACATWGAFVLMDTTIDPQLQEEVVKVGHTFFDLPQEVKDIQYKLQNFGAKWRGYMKHGGNDW
jgi:isopenicillin N synthase-like dioxygenase